MRSLIERIMAHIEATPVRAETHLHTGTHGAAKQALSSSPSAIGGCGWPNGLDVNVLRQANWGGRRGRIADDSVAALVR